MLAARSASSRGVTDASKAPVPGAAVRITNRETNQSRSAATNESGGYSFPTVPGGTYDVTVSKEGFQTFTAVTGTGREGVDERVFRFGLHQLLNPSLTSTSHTRYNSE